MKTCAIHIGKPKKHRFGSLEKYTGIVKQPILGQISVTETGLDGDGVGNLKYHGGTYKAVYAYGHQHYRWWKAQYPDLVMSVGVFGENLVVEELDERTLCVGDRFRVGEVVLQATTPRIACNTLAARIGDPDFGRKFIAAEKPGVYFQVVTAGALSVDQPWEKIASGQAGLTMVEAYRLYTGQDKSTALVSKALAEPTLIPEWRARFEK